MKYDYSNLSDREFQDLAAVIAERLFGLRFEAFGPGPDGGMDGRCVTDAGDVILQAKRYKESGSAELSSTMKAERKSIDALNPSRYILVASCTLSPPAKTKLEAAIGPSLLSTGDILGRDDVDRALDRHKDIAYRYPGLFTASAVALEAALRSIVDQSPANRLRRTLIATYIVSVRVNRRLNSQNSRK